MFRFVSLYKFVQSSCVTHLLRFMYMSLQGVEEDADGWGDDEIAEDEAKLASLSAAVHQRFPTS